MEPYFPFIIAGGYFAYKIYTNFKTMQEEAKKRNPALPHQGKNVEKPSNKRPGLPLKPVPVQPTPFLVREVKDTKHAEPIYKSVYEQPVYEQQLHQQRSAKSKTSRPAKSAIPSRIKLSDKINHDDVHEAVFHFDMKQAVINQAILERPKY